MTCLRHPGRARVVHGLTSVKISVCLTRLICIHFMRHCCELLGRSYGLAAMLSLFTDQCHRRVRDKHTHTHNITELLKSARETPIFLWYICLAFIMCRAERINMTHNLTMYEKYWKVWCLKQLGYHWIPQSFAFLYSVGQSKPTISYALGFTRARAWCVSDQRVLDEVETEGLVCVCVHLSIYLSIYLALAIYLAIYLSI